MCFFGVKQITIFSVFLDNIRFTKNEEWLAELYFALTHNGRGHNKSGTTACPGCCQPKGVPLQ